MSPRMILSQECVYCEYEQYESGRGFVITSLICRHPDHDGCWCERDPRANLECTWEEERQEEKD